MKPLFIAASCVTMVFLDLAFLSERWLRHKRRLVPNTTMAEKILSAIATFFALVGTVGLISLSILDTYHHPHLHDAFLCVFIAGWVVNAILICAEYQRLGIHNRDHPVLRASFWIKLVFILVEVPLAIAFGVCSDRGYYNAAAVLEWTIAFIFTFYPFSFFIDLLPAVRTKHRRYGAQETALEQEIDQNHGSSPEMGQYGGSNLENGHGNGLPGPDASKPPIASNF